MTLFPPTPSLERSIGSFPRPFPLAGAIFVIAATCSACSSSPHDAAGGSSGGGSSGSPAPAMSAGGSSGASSGAVGAGSSSGAIDVGGTPNGGSSGSGSGSGGGGGNSDAASSRAGAGSGAGVGDAGGEPVQGGSGATPDAGGIPRPTGGKDGGLAPPDSGPPPSGADGSTAGGVSYPYIFSVFDDSAPVSDLKIYTSNDALNFTLLYDTGYSGPSGFLRDPSIMKNTDGKFYVAFTTPPTMACCGPETSFSIASSSNLKDWTTVATVPCGVPGTKNTWAPEWFKDIDGSVYAIVNVDGKSYSYKSMNVGMTMFSAPTWIGIGPGYIDTFIVTIGATYHAFTKNNATYVEHATASSLDGPWTFVGQNDWAGWGNHKEAPALILLPTGTWRFYTDAGSTGHEMYSDSADVFQTWTAPKTLPTVGNNISHGTVIKGN